jgi:hypothetical protein
MNVTKTSFYSVLFILMASIASTTQAADNSTVYGKYYWENSSTEKYSKNVDLEVRRKNADEISISLDIVWEPGARVEIGGNANSAEVSAVTQTDGSVIYTVPFSFADGFNNTGVGTLTIHGDECLLSLAATNLVDGRAARQYSDYRLQRQN